MWKKVGVYVKSRGAALIRGAATNTEFTVISQGKSLFALPSTVGISNLTGKVIPYFTLYCREI